MRSDHRREDEVEKPKPDPRHRERYGAGGGHELHLIEDDGEWQVWLNTGIADYDGLCIGSGKDRQAAIEIAVHVAEWIEETLQGPPPTLQQVFDGEASIKTRENILVRIEPPCRPTLQYIRYANREWQESAHVNGPWVRVRDQREVAP